MGAASEDGCPVCGRKVNGTLSLFIGEPWYLPSIACYCGFYMRSGFLHKRTYNIGTLYASRMDGSMDKVVLRPADIDDKPGRSKHIRYIAHVFQATNYIFRKLS